jgi:hypothetical protein
MSLLTVFAHVALAQELPTAQAAAEVCDTRSAGWLSCETSSSPDVLECACATSPTREAYLVQVDASTFASAFDGKFLVARDLQDDQHYVRISLWIDGRATAAQIREIDVAFVAALDSALASGMALDLAAETAAQRSAAMGHEVGHALGIHHTER